MAPDPRRDAVRTRFARRRPATSTSAMSPTPSGSGAWRASAGAGVLLRIEDHDRQRCRPEYDAALLEDLDWLGFEADAGPGPPVRRRRAVRRRRSSGSGRRARLWLRLHARDVRGLGARPRPPWHGPGCPGGCREPWPRRAGPARRARRRLRALDGPDSSARAPTRSRTTATALIRDRDGNWTYGFAVVVDDLRQGVDLVVRGRDLLVATPRRSGSAPCSGERRRPRSPTTR